ncbi:MAG: hypothetical protein JNJ52_01275 [Flavobacterium sp.]|nr:hypothetical protein [Flavobacterium sp.]
MAKIIHYEGKLPKRIGDCVVYPLNGQLIVRAKSGFTTKALKTSVKYAQCRSNAHEFGRVSRLCKVMRQALWGILPRQHNLVVVNGLTKKMRALLDLDGVNAVGERNLAVAFAQVEAQQAFEGYAFNPMTALDVQYTMTNTQVSGAITAVPYTENATHLGWRVHALAFDFAAPAHQLTSGDWQYTALAAPNWEFAVERPMVGDGTGVVLTLLEVALYAQAKDGYAPCADGSKTVLVVGVGR